MSNNYYLGQTPEEFMNQTSRYFYGIARNADGFLTVTKVNLDTSTEAISLEDPNSVGTLDQTYDQFEEGVDFFEGVDATTRMPNYQGLKFEQYKWSADDLYYYVDGQGNLVVRVDFPYNYSEGATSYVLPETILVGASVDLGTLLGSTNPMENLNIVDLSLISDHEGTLIALDMGTIV
jgi:hypothetical protein